MPPPVQPTGRDASAARPGALGPLPAPAAGPEPTAPARADEAERDNECEPETETEPRSRSGPDPDSSVVARPRAPPADHPPSLSSPAPTTPHAAADRLHKTLPSTPLDGPEPGPEHPPNPMASSAATLRPAGPRPPPLLDHADSRYLAAEPSGYVDPTPATPRTSQPPSRTPSNARSHRSDDLSPFRSDEDKRDASEDERDGGSRSEIQSIMDQFSEAGGGPGEDEVMSPRLEIASPMLGGSMQLPPRKSSLEPLAPSISGHLQDLNALRLSTGPPLAATGLDGGPTDEQGPPVPPKDGAFGTPPRSREARKPGPVASPTSPSMQMHRPPPPDPEPEPALPFDFHRFLEQLRNKKADPVARYLKSFLSEFAKKQWMVHEQVKIISDFLAFIANKMVQCDVWRDVSDAEFDNAREGMEKLVMNRLYAQTFSPAIAPPKPIPGAKPKRRGGDVPMGPGRRGQHQEDVERDDILTQKINIYGWVKEEHLDIPPVGESGRRFLKLAQQGWSAAAPRSARRAPPSVCLTPGPQSC